MKNLVIAVMAIMAVGFTSCKDDNKGKLDPNSRIYINGLIPKADGQPEPGKFTPLEIVKQAQEIATNQWRMGIGDWNRDIVNTRFVLGSDYIVNKQGELVLTGITARNYLFVTWQIDGNPKDTVAYIPNATMDVAEDAIRTAYSNGNFDECNRLFMEAFTFVPITRKEYRELKAAGNI